MSNTCAPARAIRKRDELMPILIAILIAAIVTATIVAIMEDQ